MPANGAPELKSVLRGASNMAQRLRNFVATGGKKWGWGGKVLVVMAKRGRTSIDRLAPTVLSGLSEFFLIASPQIGILKCLFCLPDKMIAAAREAGKVTVTISVSKFAVDCAIFHFPTISVRRSFLSV